MLLALMSLAGWLVWAAVWWYALQHGWTARFVFDRYNEHWVEGVLIHGLVVFSFIHVFVAFRK